MMINSNLQLVNVNDVAGETREVAAYQQRRLAIRQDTLD
jgi:hypothetical protein